MEMKANLELLQKVLSKARKEVARVVIGQEDAVNASLIAIFTGSHALIEGVPGVGKTLLVRTLAKVLGCEFARIQFTPDLMPADITGTHIFDLQKSAFKLVKGPVFTTFLLADEINRAPAKTQSALLQAMQERTVTIDRSTHELSPNFTVFATQNPIEYEGTYPLPEAQKDRFMLKIVMGPPDRDDELSLARRMLGEDSPESVLAREEVKPIVTTEMLGQPSQIAFGGGQNRARIDRLHRGHRQGDPQGSQPSGRSGAEGDAGPSAFRSRQCRRFRQGLRHAGRCETDGRPGPRPPDGPSAGVRNRRD